MSEYSVPLPGTARSKLGRAEMDEPCTRNSTGRGGSPVCGRPARLRKRLSETSPFFAQYSELQIGPDAAGWPTAGAAASRPSPRPAPLISERRGRARSVDLQIWPAAHDGDARGAERDVRARPSLA